MALEFRLGPQDQANGHAHSPTTPQNLDVPSFQLGLTDSTDQIHELQFSLTHAEASQRHDIAEALQNASHAHDPESLDVYPEEDNLSGLMTIQR